MGGGLLEDDVPLVGGGLLEDDGPDHSADDEDGAGEVVPYEIDEGMVHLEELLPALRNKQLLHIISRATKS